jgi:acid phosphatase
MEDMPHACFTGASSGRYAKKHDPFIYFDDLVSDPAKCNNVVPLSTIDYNALPSLVWITPNLCNDTHDCSVATGDRYLSKLVPNVLHGLGPHGVVFITYDEGSSGAHGGGHVFTVVAGPGVRPGRYSRTFDHYALLRTIEDAFGLPHLAHAAGAPSMASILS